MKKFRKLTAVITALCLAGSMMATMSMLNVSAAGETYSITINNDVSGQTYGAYQIFAGKYSEGVLSDITWGSGLDSNKLSNLVNDLKALTLTDGNTKPFASVPEYSDTNDKSASAVADVLGAITQADAEITRKFADVVAKYLSNNKTQLDYDNSSTPKKYTANINDPGYYLVQDEIPIGTGDNNSYTRYILQVVGNAEANHKNSVPTVMKKVKENTKYNDIDTKDSKIDITLNNANDKGWNDVADYNIGDTVPFRLYGSMPSNIEYYNAYRYIFHDTLDSSLSLNESSITVKIGNETVDPDCYTIVISNGNGNIRQDETFTIEFKDIKTVKNTEDTAITVDKDTIVVVDYTATLTSSAVIGLDGQQNEVYLEYSNNPNWDGDGSTPDNPGGSIPDTPGEDDKDTTGETPEDQVIVFTYELDITKIGETDTKYLGNAKFLLSTGKNNDDNTKVDNSKLVKVYEDNAGNYSLVQDTTYTTEANTSTNPLKTNTTDGKILIKGLDQGTYYLEETEAPTGYNKLEGLVQLDITANTQNGQSWGGTPTDALKDWINTDEGYEAPTNATETATGLKLKTTLLNSSGETVGAPVISYSLAKDTDNSINEDARVKALIQNNKGSSLPSTGGIGTTIFYMVGGVLVVGAGVTLIAKKRMKNNEQ